MKIQSHMIYNRTGKAVQNEKQQRTSQARAAVLAANRQEEH